MPNYVTSITVDQVIDALATFLAPFLGSVKTVRGQVNRVPLPKGAAVVLTEILSVDLETPITSDDPVTEIATVKGPKRIDVQIDFYGPGAGEQCAAVQGVYRSIYATSKFPANITPLYCSDGMQAPLTTGEQQYLTRWTLTASLQYNPSVTVPQQSADELSAAVPVAVDV